VRDDYEKQGLRKASAPNGWARISVWDGQRAVERMTLVIFCATRRGGPLGSLRSGLVPVRMSRRTVCVGCMSKPCP
jgi:hypothetical protein